MWCVVLAREGFRPSLLAAYPPRHAPLRDAQTLSNLGVLATLLVTVAPRLLELLRILFSLFHPVSLIMLFVQLILGRLRVLSTCPLFGEGSVRDDC
jgi:hypothetical protein